jgi:nucleoside phosphorylase
MRDTADIVLFTVNDHETRETQAAFGAASPAISKPPYRYWDYGEIGGARVVHMLCNMADLAAGKSARAAIAAWQPTLLVALGIAWGAPHKNRAIGDLLLAAPLSDSAHAKISNEHGMQPRGDMWPQADSLMQTVKSCHWDWGKLAPDERRTLHAGKVLSLPTLIDKKSLRDELLAAHPGSIGGEMEGRGLVDAAVEKKCDWLVLKAICDWGAEKNADDAQKELDQAFAAKQAATFLRFAIEQGVGSLAVSLRSATVSASGPSGANVTMNIGSVSGTVIGSVGTVNINHGLRPGDVIDGGNF